MPNQTLIEQLDSLRESALRQQKTAAALQGKLKNVTKAQAQAQKALSDYAEQNGGDVKGAQKAFANARLKEEAVDPLMPGLRRETAALTKLAAALRDASTALNSHPVDVVRLDKAISGLEALQQEALASLLPDLKEELDVAQRALADDFGKNLRDALAAQGMSLSRNGNRFAIGRFELEANFAKRSLSLRYGLDMVNPRIAITVEAALKALQSASKLILERTQDGKAWMAQFHEAYQNARNKRGGDSARVSLIDIYLEMVILRQGRNFFIEPSKRTMSDYTRAQFIYDFYHFTGEDRTAHNNQFVRAHVATKSQTESPAKSLWIVEGDGPYDGRYIADVDFVKG
jgi:hypothetical protein